MFSDMTQTPETDRPRYSCHFLVAPAAIDDEFVVQAHIAQQIEDARRDAAARGLVLIGAPSVNSEPVYWIDDFHGDGAGAIVGEHLATPDIGARLTGFRFTLEWAAQVVSLSLPWIVRLDNDMYHLRKGKPTRIIVEHSEGGDVTHADVDALYELINNQK